MTENKFSIELGDRKLTIQTGLLANQSSGSVLVTLGDTVVFASATLGEAREGVDFLALSVDFEEKFYAAGKIKGSRFMKREGRPSEKSILSSRLIDRPIRPMFPKNMANEVQVICSVLSADLEVDPATTGLIAASAAIAISGMPFEAPVSAVRIGLISDENGEEKLILNPTYKQEEEGKLSLVVAGTFEAITMVEAFAKEVDEETMLKALELAHKEIKRICLLQQEFVSAMGKSSLRIECRTDHNDALTAIANEVTKEQLDSIKGTKKSEVKEKMSAIQQMLFEKLASQIDSGVLTKTAIKQALNTLFEKNMRLNILEKEIRIDGRSIDEIRPVSVLTGVLPRTHGSALFQRGETQSLSITTLGAPGSALVVDTMDEDIEKKYFHHYNFPPFSVGEVKPLRGPSRRDIGHGNLAERALFPVLPKEEVFPYTIWVVSEIMSCNGSSSMASVCGSSMSLMDAGVPIKKPVAGIAMGLVTYDGDLANGYKILTDIQGMEDFAGDMDFKVAGTKDAITALQMDIKVKGLSIDLLREALKKAKVAREKILEEMTSVLAKPREELAKTAPRIISLRIDPEKIREVIGKGGETIQKIIKETGVEIDINDDGLVMITSVNQDSAQKALTIIEKITYVPKVGDIIEGKVVRITDFGAFVQLTPTKDGLLHISEVDNKRVENIKEYINEGDIVKVKVIGIDEQDRIKLSRKVLLEA